MPSSTIAGVPSAAVGGRPPRELLLTGLASSLAAALALVVSLSVRTPNLGLSFAVAAGAIAVVALIAIPRLEVTVTVLVLYLGLFDGPVKLLSASQAASSVRDVLIGAICLGALARLSARHERLRLPPLTGWVLVFVALVLAEALNPSTHGIVKVIGGFRQQLEWVPFFFFGYALMRSRSRFRHLFAILGVLALANGVVSTYQTGLTPAQLASWGPGYAEHVHGGAGLTAQRYRASNGELVVRPPGLGSDSGFGGSVGLIALPGILVLLASGSRRWRLLAIPLGAGAILAIATGLGRLQVVGAAIAVVLFALLCLSAGRRARAPLLAVLALLALAAPIGVVLASTESSGFFSRYASIAPGSVVTTSTSYKEESLALLPHYVARAPFGFGLATAGPAAGFGGNSKEQLEGHGVTAETQYNYVEDELGLPGLILWVALTLTLVALVAVRLPRVRDTGVRIELAAVFAVVFAYSVMGLRGAFMDSASGAPFFWFALGIAAYWLAGPGLRQPAEGAQRSIPALAARGART
ncbi:MAG TPA: hypothetical protein VHU13_03520 [Solirubrobacteraceae bacterium]|jgi:hypothetical protein|nr:hypothetical protein [Solirubrobacteraceae bacterium]